MSRFGSEPFETNNPDTKAKIKSVPGQFRKGRDSDNTFGVFKGTIKKYGVYLCLKKYRQ